MRSQRKSFEVLDLIPIVRVSQVEAVTDSYTEEMMEAEIQRVSRELYKAFSGLNAGFEEAKDQVVIDELSTHTDIGRQEAIHPYKVRQN